MDQRLRPIERLQHSHEFREIFERGRCFRTPFLRIHYRPSSREYSRLGLVVTRKIGGAVQRNRVKRLLRDVFRRQKGSLPATLDIILIPQGGERPHAEYVEAFLHFLERTRAAETARS